MRFAYTDSARSSLPIGAPLLSCSLPLDGRPLDGLAFFEGLLPEGQHRADLAARADVTASDTLGLLARYGRDIAGAVTLLGEDRPDQRVPGVVPLSDGDLHDELVGLPERALGVHDDSELSLAGLQDKLLLVQLPGGGWGRPTGGYPSTHIIKRDPPRYPGVVAAEAQCTRLARAVGLTSIDVEVLTVDGVDHLVVERFDRRVERGSVVRIHQEDTCQALGVLPSAKYETRHGGGGPELSQIASLLNRFAADPLDALDRLARIATFTALIGNADAHGKNVALLHPEPGVVELAPLYDQVPTRMWPTLQARASMTISAGIDLDTVTPDRIAAEAKAWDFTPNRALEAAVTTAEAVRSACADGTIDPEGAVATFARARTERFLAR